MTGVNLELYTTKDELIKLHKHTPIGIAIKAWTKEGCPPEAIYHISVPFEVCTLKDDNEVIVEPTMVKYNEISTRFIIAASTMPIDLSKIQ